MSNSQTAATGKVVSIHFTLTQDDGTVLDKSIGGEPLSYLHGADQIVPGLEKKLEGQATGFKTKATVTPQEGYGERDEDARQTVDRSTFPPDAKLHVGMGFNASIENAEHSLIGRIVDIQGDHITVDFNPPLAGMTLHFDVEIVEVRDATDEEKTHGHAHGGDCGHDH